MARQFFVTAGVGFFTGTATHWMLFWTDTLSSEFPPMGGILVGFAAALCWAFPVILNRRLVFGLAFLLGHFSAASCRPLSLLNLFNAIPRNFATAWTSAVVAFALSMMISRLMIRSAVRWRLSREASKLPAR